MQWLLILAASAYCIVSCISGAAAAQTLSEGRKKELREIIERETQKDTVKWVNKFLADANARGTDGNKEELGRAIQGVKNIIYHTAYSKYRCVLMHPNSMPEANECFVRLSGSLVTQYFNTAWRTM